MFKPRLLIIAFATLWASSSTAGNVRPARPNAESHVSIKVPHSGGSGCSIQVSVSRIQGRGRTELKASAYPTGRCRRAFSPGHVWHAVGKLNAGRYVVKTSEGSASFMVLPIAPTPDKVTKGPAALFVKRKIVDAYSPSTCYDNAGSIKPEEIRKMRKRKGALWKAAKRFWPSATDEQLMRRVAQLDAISLKRGTGRAKEWGFTIREGCCSRTLWSGRVTIVPQIHVGPRRQSGVEADTGCRASK